MAKLLTEHPVAIINEITKFLTDVDIAKAVESSRCLSCMKKSNLYKSSVGLRHFHRFLMEADPRRNDMSFELRMAWYGVSYSREFDKSRYAKISEHVVRVSPNNRKSKKIFVNSEPRRTYFDTYKGAITKPGYYQLQFDGKFDDDFHVRILNSNYNYAYITMMNGSIVVPMINEFKIVAKGFDGNIKITDYISNTDEYPRMSKYEGQNHKLNPFTTHVLIAHKNPINSASIVVANNITGDPLNFEFDKASLDAMYTRVTGKHRPNNHVILYIKKRRHAFFRNSFEEYYITINGKILDVQMNTESQDNSAHIYQDFSIYFMTYSMYINAPTYKQECNFRFQYGQTS